MIAAVLLLLSFVITVFIYWYTLNRVPQSLKKFPGPPTTFLFGNALDFQSTDSILSKLCEYVNTYGEIVRLKIGVRHVLVVTNNKLAQFILTNPKTYEKADDYNFFKNWLGNGLLTAEHSIWRVHRKMLTPAFHLQLLEKFVVDWDELTRTVIEILEKHTNGENFEISELIDHTALDIVCESAMGVSLNTLNNENLEYFSAVEKLTRLIPKRTASFIKQINATYIFTEDYYAEKKALKIVHNFSNFIIKSRRRELEEKLLSKKEEPVNKKLPFLDTLLLARDENGNGLSDEDIRAHVDTLMFGSYHTSSSSIRFLLYCLANNPDIQDRVYKEQQCIFANRKNDSISCEDLGKMTYLEQVIKETLRLYPPVSFLGRSLAEDAEFDGTILPKGLTFVLLMFELHRNEKYFPNPMKFDPSRFDAGKELFPYSYLPFSGGSRNCIGYKYAYFEVKYVAARILHNFELLPSTSQKKIELKLEIVLKAANGIELRFKKRPKKIYCTE